MTARTRVKGKRQECESSILTTVREKVEENREAIKYVALFLGLCFAFYMVYYSITVSGSGIMLHVKSVITLILSAIFSLIGMDVVTRGAVLSINGYSIEIIDECTAIFSCIVYCSCVLAYPATRKQKSLGILVGVPCLYAINIVRIFILTLVGMHNPNMFEFMHVYLWQASFIIFVVVLFLLWLKVGVTDVEGG